MTTRFNRILFDYDGTLIIHDKNTEGEIIAKLLNIDEEKIPEFVKRLNYLFEISYGRYYYRNHKMTYELFYSLLERIMNPFGNFGITAKELDDAINYKSIYLTDLAPNAVEVLEYLSSKGYKLCVFTNGFYMPQAKNMREHKIYNYFERVYSWDCYYAKPDIRALYRALDGTNPKENVMIGDGITSDIIPAKRLGVYTIGYNIENIQRAKTLPDVVITDLAELKQIL